MSSLRVVVAGYGPIYRAGLCAVLPTNEDGNRVAVVGAAGELPKARSLVTLLRPDVIVSDLEFPENDPIAALKAACSTTRILVLGDVRDPAQGARYLRHGADGYLIRPVSKENLLEALFSVGSGDSYADPRLPSPTPLIPRGLERASLSEREREVLRLIALGYTNAEAATYLVISIRTVETHRANIQRKLGVRTRAELARAAFRERMAVLSFTEQTTTA